jgi:hypothetical protein
MTDSTTDRAERARQRADEILAESRPIVQHEPWCANHSGRPPADNWCVSATVEAASVQLFMMTDLEDGQPRILLGGQGCVDITIGEALDLADALNGLAAQATPVVDVYLAMRTVDDICRFAALTDEQVAEEAGTTVERLGELRSGGATTVMQSELAALSDATARLAVRVALQRERSTV